MNIRCAKIQILQIFLSLISHYQRTYCWPTRKKILKLLKKRYNTEISPSALDQHLSGLLTGKYIKSFQRRGRHDDGTIHNLPSNRQLTWKSVAFLIQHGIKVPRWLFAWLKSGVLPGGRKPPKKTTSQTITEQGERRSRASAPENIAGMIENALGELKKVPSPA